MMDGSNKGQEKPRRGRDFSSIDRRSASRGRRYPAAVLRPIRLDCSKGGRREPIDELVSAHLADLDHRELSLERLSELLLGGLPKRSAEIQQDPGVLLESHDGSRQMNVMAIQVAPDVNEIAIPDSLRASKPIDGSRVT
jgi:hypothetical protein